MENLFAQAVGLSALAVVLVQQVLKSKLIPLSFANKYPVPTLVVLSVIASVVAVMKTPLNPQEWYDWVWLVLVVAVAAALTYRTTFKNWKELRETEGYK